MIGTGPAIVATLRPLVSAITIMIGRGRRSEAPPTCDYQVTVYDGPCN